MIDETPDKPHASETHFLMTEDLGRMMETPFGRERVVMKGMYWAYLEWFELRGFDRKALARHCYEKHPELEISVALPWLLHTIYLHREQQNLPNPSFLIAAELPRGMESF